MIDRVAADLGRRVAEVPVGFKWFVDGLLGGSFGFGGEESAGASFLRRDSGVWTTDKDGILLALLAAEITAKTGRDPGEHYRRLTERFGDPVYRRLDAPASREQKAVLAALSPEQVTIGELAGEAVTAKLTHAPGNWRRDRRAQGGGGERLVRRPPFGNRGDLQDLRRELSRRGSPGADPRRGPGDRRGGVHGCWVVGWGLPHRPRKDAVKGARLRALRADKFSACK